MAASPVAGRPTNRPSPQVLHRLRAGLCVLTAVLTEVVLIAAVGNQAAATAIAKHNQNPTTFSGHLLRSLLTYSWRFTPLSGDVHRVWPAQLARLGTVLVLTGLLVWAVSRGVGGFARVFFGTWMAVLVATQLGQIVYGLVVDVPRLSARSRIVAAFFGRAGTAPSAETFFAALMLGLLAALLTAIVAMATRRRAGVLMPIPPGTDEADTWLWGDEDYRAAAARSAAERWPPRDWNDPTMAMPGRAPYGGPPYGPPPGGPPYGSPTGGPPQGAPPPAWGPPPPRSAPQRAEGEPDRTQAYDFSEDPEFADDQPQRRESGDEPTQQLDLPRREGGSSDTREMPPVREE